MRRAYLGDPRADGRSALSSRFGLWGAFTRIGVRGTGGLLFLPGNGLHCCARSDLLETFHNNRIARVKPLVDNGVSVSLRAYRYGNRLHLAVFDDHQAAVRKGCR